MKNLKVQSASGGKNVWQYKSDGDITVAITIPADKAPKADENGRKVLKAGFIYPEQGATAIGVLQYDVDLTDGDSANASLIQHGAVKEDICREASGGAVTAATKTALAHIMWYDNDKQEGGA